MKIPALIGSTLLLAPAIGLALQEEEAAEGGGGIFAVDLGLSVWTIVVFLIVMFVLGKYAWGPILAALDSREAGIKDAIATAEENRKEAEAVLEEHRKQLAEARREAQDIVAEGREAGQKLRADIEAKAREEGERMIERARAEIERERERAVEQLRRESVDIAMAAASSVIGRKMDEQADRALVEEYLSKLQPPTAEA